MNNRFQSIEQTLSWFSPCVLFCAAPFLVAIAVYTIVRVVRGKQGRASVTMYDPASPAQVQRVDRATVKFERPKDASEQGPPAGSDEKSGN